MAYRYPYMNFTTIACATSDEVSIYDVTTIACATADADIIYGYFI
jgi:hypothetical protein